MPPVYPISRVIEFIKKLLLIILVLIIILLLSISFMYIISFNSDSNYSLFILSSLL